MSGLSPLRLGALVTFGTMAFAGIAGLVAVFDADSVASGFGRGFGIAALVFLAGATIACALACLVRARVEVASVASIAAAGIALDLLVLAIWLEIEDEAYAKATGVVFVWSVFALVVLGLTLAVRPRERLARALYGGAVGAAVLAGAISTWLVVTAGDGVGSVRSFGLTPGGTSNDESLRVLGAALVVLAALWFSALAASRLEHTVP